MAWQVKDLQDQSGRVVVITGGNSGIGYEAAKALAGCGAQVVIACRDIAKGKEACTSIKKETGTEVSTELLDLSSLQSVHIAAEAIKNRYDHIDVLINNAGVMAIPRRLTEDGFETQLATNHFGHFALTALLFPLLRDTPDARVVTVSSLAHQFGYLNFINLHGQAFYDPWAAYGQSKLANLLFAFELDRRCRAAGVSLRSNACHPGIAATNLGYAGPRMMGSTFGETLIQFYTSIVAQSAADGALPTLYAGFAPEADGGDYIGPDGLGEMRGNPRKVPCSFLSRSEPLARQLWAVTEEATQIEFAL
ncbi:MAG: oxidoreductase [Pseudomonadales bacterium]